jgi:hypothetical protein
MAKRKKAKRSSKKKRPTSRRKKARRKKPGSGPSKVKKSILRTKFQMVAKEIKSVEKAYVNLQRDFKRVANTVAANIRKTMTVEPKRLGKKFLQKARKDVRKVQAKLTKVNSRLSQMEQRLRSL